MRGRGEGVAIVKVKATVRAPIIRIRLSVILCPFPTKFNLMVQRRESECLENTNLHEKSDSLVTL